ncbi:MAG: hypothetical protein NTX45_04750 [Proteobacteria bacterium]|nr:hypothetical protein [Pseudomonadota bacterium]
MPNSTVLPLDDRCGPFDFIVDGLARREHLEPARIRPVRVAPNRQRDKLPGFAKVPDGKPAAPQPVEPAAGVEIPLRVGR